MALDDEVTATGQQHMVLNLRVCNDKPDHLHELIAIIMDSALMTARQR